MKFFLTPLAPSGPLRSKKFQKTLILAFEANSALSYENETKIVKITHSAGNILNSRFRPRFLTRRFQTGMQTPLGQKNGLFFSLRRWYSKPMTFLTTRWRYTILEEHLKYHQP